MTAARLAWAAALLAPTVATAQSPGNSANGQILFNNNACASCHSLAAQRAQITNRAPNAGTLTYDKSLAALNAALSGTDLDGVSTGMNVSFGTLTTQQRADIAAYIAGLPAPAPIVNYSPAGGPVFPATAVGAMSSATVTITNTGTADLVFVTNNAVTIATGGDAADFRVTSSTCPGATLQPNTGSCVINATFQPLAGASLTRSASLGLTAMSGVTLVPMTGVVVSASSPPPAPPGAANPPSSGGGGALPALGVLLLALATLLRRSDAMRQSFAVSIRGLAGAALLALAFAASAQDANRGQALWYNAPGVKNNATILPCQSCHSQGPTIKMGRTAVMINAAIVGNTGGMGIFNNILNVGGATSVDLLDLQAFLVNPTAIPLAIATAPASLNFGNQALATTSAVMTVTVSHGTGSAAAFQLAAANAISIGGTNASDFAIAPGGTCANSLNVAIGGSCTINLTFTPTGATGAKGASLQIAFATQSVPTLSVILTGNATAVATPTISLSATSLTFANQVQSTTSAAQTITLTNSGAGTLNLSSLTTGGTNAADFTRGGTCMDGGTVAPSASCTITYTFTPAALGARSGTLTIVSNNPGGNVVVSLAGTGVGNTPTITINPTTLTFSTVLGQTSAVQNVTVSNAGGGTLNVTGAALAAANAAYMVTNGCTAGLATNASCTIGISFTPAALGANNATLNITHDAVGSPSTVTLNGTGVSTVPVVSRNPATLNFPLTAVGQQSATQRVTFSNAGPGAATISTIVPSPGFATAAPVTGACANGGTVASGASCFVDVRFVPGAAGAATGTLTINSNGTPGATTVALTGTGTATVAPIVGYAPAGGPLFAPTQAGSTSAAIRVTITNVGTAAMVFPASGAATITTGFNPADFRVAATTCTASTTLQPNTGNCTVDVTFAPAAAGSATRTAILLISYSGGADQVPLTGVVIGATGAGTPSPPPSTGGSSPVAPTGGSSDGGGGSLPWQWLGLLLLGTLAPGRRRSE